MDLPMPSESSSLSKPNLAILSSEPSFEPTIESSKPTSELSS
jgi:hypothetical protein